MKRVLFIFLTVSLLMSACKGTSETSLNPLQEVVDPLGAYLDQIEVISQEWDDAIELADSTSRANLPDRVAELQAIRRRAQFLEVPTEAESAHKNLVRAMNSAIDAFLAFMLEKDYETYFSQYDTFMEKWSKGLAEIKKD